MGLTELQDMVGGVITVAAFLKNGDVVYVDDEAERGGLHPQVHPGGHRQCGRFLRFLCSAGEYIPFKSGSGG